MRHETKRWMEVTTLLIALVCPALVFGQGVAPPADVGPLGPVWAVIEDILAHWQLIGTFVLALVALYGMIKAKVEKKAKGTVMEAVEINEGSKPAGDRPITNLVDQVTANAPGILAWLSRRSLQKKADSFGHK